MFHDNKRLVEQHNAGNHSHRCGQTWAGDLPVTCVLAQLPL